MPATQLSLLADDREILETNYFVGEAIGRRTNPARPRGPYRARSRSHCLESMAGTGVNASTIADDVMLDMLLNHIPGHGRRPRCQSV